MNNYEKFLRMREGHVANALYYIKSLQDKLALLEKTIKDDPEKADYYHDATHFATYAAPAIPLIMRELLSVRTEYEQWKPGAEDYE